MKKKTLSRLQLYRMVWKEPLTTISKRFHITYSELRQIYHEMNIPVPEGGYWSKLRWEKPTVITKLPEEYSGKLEIELFEKEDGDPMVNSDKSEKKEDVNPESAFKVPARLTNPDILVTRAKEYFETNRQFWGHNQRFLEGKEILSIDVRIVNLPRALRIFDTIIKVLRTREHDISFDWSGTVAVIYGQKVAMRLREVYRVSEKPIERSSTRELEPTGKFTFMIGRYNEKAVTDGQKLLIEDKIDIIISKLEAEAKYWYDWQIKREMQEKEQKEQERIRQEARDRKNKELLDFKSLYIQANRLHQASIMRNYIAAIERNIQERGEETVEFRAWAKWAREKIDWYDPLINRIDPILDNIDKSELYYGIFLKDQE